MGLRENFESVFGIKIVESSGSFRASSRKLIVYDGSDESTLAMNFSWPVGKPIDDKALEAVRQHLLGVAKKRDLYFDSTSEVTPQQILAL